MEHFMAKMVGHFFGRVRRQKAVVVKQELRIFCQKYLLLKNLVFIYFFVNTILKIF